jgi:hypothetical protein
VLPASTKTLDDQSSESKQNILFIEAVDGRCGGMLPLDHVP